MTSASHSLLVKMRGVLRRTGALARRNALAAAFVLLGAAAFWWPAWLELFGFHPADPLWRAYQVDGDVGAMAWSPNGRKLAVSIGLDGAVGVLDLESGKMLWEVRKEVTGRHSVAFTPDGKYVVTPTAESERAIAGAALDLRDAESGRLVREVPGIHPHDETAQGNIGQSFAFSADGKLLVVASGARMDDPATVYSTETWQEVRRLYAGHAFLDHTAISQGGRAAFGTAGGKIIIFDLASGVEERAIKAYRYGMIRSLAFSPDGKFLVSGAFSANDSELEPDPLRIWRAEDGAKVRSHDSYSLWSIDSIAWSPDGDDIAWTSRNGSVYLWHIRSSDEPVTVIELSHPSFAVAFSPDGRHLAIGGRYQVFMQKLEQ